MDAVLAHLHRLAALSGKGDAMFSWGRVAGKAEDGFSAVHRRDVDFKGLVRNKLPGVELDLRFRAAPVFAAPLGAKPRRGIHLPYLLEQVFVADDDNIERHHAVLVCVGLDIHLEGERFGGPDQPDGMQQRASAQQSCGGKGRTGEIAAWRQGTPLEMSHFEGTTDAVNGRVCLLPQNSNGTKVYIAPANCGSQT